MTLTPGARLGPYQILAPLGAGGMGEVYRAQDPRLGREVAIKVLPAALMLEEDRLARFEQEARAVSALNHPNILTVHDVGTHEGAPYLVTELLEGRTLREVLEAPLPLETATDYARQLANGLAAAHSKNIVHRDLKPENIFVTTDGRVKILDFGLAKLQPSSLPDAATASMPAVATQTGVVVGTIGYMSPEQVAGARVDHRTDLFSLGVVLYEMVTGRRAFPGQSLAALLAVMHEDPPAASSIRAEVPGPMTELIRRCLAKDPEKRVQSAREVLAELDSPRAGAGTRPARGPMAVVLVAIALLAVVAVLLMRGGGFRSRIDAVAVLPFTSEGGGEDATYLAEGLTDGLIAELAQVGSLKVISRASGALAADSKKSIPEMAKALAVGAVVRGSLRRDRDSVRVTVALLRARDGAVVWKRDDSVPLDRLPHVSVELARGIAAQTGSELVPSEQQRLARRPDVDRRAYDAYLRGRFYMEQDQLEQAHAMFEQARTIAPNWAPAYVGLASYYTALPFTSDVPPVDVLPKARAAVVKALELDESLAEAHSTHAYVLAYYEWDWQAAEKEFRRALALQPSYGDAHFSYSRFLASRGRLDEAIAQIRLAVALDPLTPSLQANSALLDYFSGRYPEAYTELQAVLRTDSTNTTARWGTALVNEQLGNPAAAIAILEPISGSSPNRLSSLGHAYAVAGQTAKARAVLDTLRAISARSYVPAYWFALVHVGLGEPDEAMQWLERAYQERSTVLAYLRIDPRLKPLHENPRFRALMEHLGAS